MALTLSFSSQVGDNITVLARVNEEWVCGRLKSGQEGMFPASFVDHLPEELPLQSELEKRATEEVEKEVKVRRGGEMGR